jgi:thioredoxin 1
MWMLSSFNSKRRKQVSDLVAHLEDAEFKAKVLDSAQPVLIDFWAPWCYPCRNLAPIVEELAGDYEGKVTFFKMNTDENPKTPGEYGIMSIPTLLLFKNGKLLDKSVGLKAKGDLSKFIDAAI